MPWFVKDLLFTLAQRLLQQTISHMPHRCSNEHIVQNAEKLLNEVTHRHQVKNVEDTTQRTTLDLQQLLCADSSSWL